MLLLKTWFIHRLHSFCVSSMKYRGYKHCSILVQMLWKVNCHVFVVWLVFRLHGKVVDLDFQHYSYSRCFVKGLIANQEVQK